MRRRQQGFTIVELLIAIAVTLIVMTAALMIYQRSVQVAGVVGSRGEMQAELRASLDQISRDLNQAGTGMQSITLSIPSAATGGTNPFIGRDGVNPPYLTATLTSGVLYKVTPENGVGPTTTEPTDAIVITYVEPVSSDPKDPNASGTAPNWSIPSPTQPTPPAPHPQYAVSLSTDGTLVTMPDYLTPPMNDPAVGLVIGDLMELQNSAGIAVGIVTNYDPAAHTISFAANDPLNINQPTAPVGNIAAIASGTQTLLSRIMMVTYFIQAYQTPNGTDYRLMRQVGARTPTPVAEHIEDLQFTYDVYDDSSGTITVGLPDAATGSPPTPKPNQIRKVNITLTARSSRPNAQGNYDRLTITTSIGPRNLSFHEKYN